MVVPGVNRRGLTLRICRRWRRDGRRLDSVEEARWRGGCRRVGRGQAEVLPGAHRKLPASGGAGKEAGLHQVRLDDILERLDRLTDGGGHGLESNRAPPL